MKGLTDIKDLDEAITIGNEESMHATKVGNLKREVTQLDGSKFTVMLKEVKYVADLCVSFFSLNNVLKNGFNLSNDNISIRLSKGLVMLTFD